jgi:hypothetical protein
VFWWNIIFWEYLNSFVKYFLSAWLFWEKYLKCILSKLNFRNFKWYNKNLKFLLPICFKLNFQIDPYNVFFKITNWHLIFLNFQIGPCFSNFIFDPKLFKIYKSGPKCLQWNFLSLYPNTHLKIKVIQIQLFEFLIFLNPLKCLIIPSKHTLRIYLDGWMFWSKIQFKGIQILLSKFSCLNH